MMRWLLACVNMVIGVAPILGVSTKRNLITSAHLLTLYYPPSATHCDCDCEGLCVASQLSELMATAEGPVLSGGQTN
jgi:hypothetical protein